MGRRFKRWKGGSTVLGSRTCFIFFLGQKKFNRKFPSTGCSLRHSGPAKKSLAPNIQSRRKRSTFRNENNDRRKFSIQFSYIEYVCFLPEIICLLPKHDVANCLFIASEAGALCTVCVRCGWNPNANNGCLVPYRSCLFSKRIVMEMLLINSEDIIQRRFNAP